MARLGCAIVLCGFAFDIMLFSFRAWELAVVKPHATQWQWQKFGLVCKHVVLADLDIEMIDHCTSVLASYLMCCCSVWMFDVRMSIQSL